MSYMCANVLRNEIRVRNVAQFNVLDPDTLTRRRITEWECVFYIAHEEAVLTAVGTFSFLAGLVVFGFMVYQLYLVLGGRTANEAFKWEDLEYDLQHKHVTEITKAVLEYNRNFGTPAAAATDDATKQVSLEEEAASSTISTATKRKKSKNQKDHDSREYEPEMIAFTSLKQVRNIYDRGVWRNLYDTVFPAQIN
ncbi:hypothetical protein HDU98_001903 [Podochytrium sp. JEL0797]|nr:hypothetical protein HDU98_001903 [Podochytrium sp. JEL0797]